MRTHGGICIGGPLAGRFYTHETYTMAVDQLPALPFDGRAAGTYAPDVVYTTTTYRFITIATEEGGELRTGAWVLPQDAPPSGRMTPMELLELMSRYYAEVAREKRYRL